MAGVPVGKTTIGRIKKHQATVLCPKCLECNRGRFVAFGRQCDQFALTHRFCALPWG